MKYLVFVITFLITSCQSVDYYNSDNYQIRQRQKESLRMMKEVQKVRRKCSSNKRTKRVKRKKYYS